MSGLGSLLRQAHEQLAAQDVGCALVGGIAVSVRTEPRFTRDVDLCVAVDADREAEAVVRHFLAAGFGALAVVEQEAKGRLATVRLRAPGRSAEAAVVDLLFASSGIEAEIAAAAEPLAVLDDVVVPVARVGDLIALKVLARDDRRRPQDRVDLTALFAAADEAELARARASLRLIEQRSSSRGRALRDDLDAALVELR